MVTEKKSKFLLRSNKFDPKQLDQNDHVHKYK